MKNFKSLCMRFKRTWFVVLFLALNLMLFFAAGSVHAVNLVTESFTGAGATYTNWPISGNAAFLTATTQADGSSGTVVKLTPATNTQAGTLVYDKAFSSALTATVTFDYFMGGGTGADGFSVFLVDGATTSVTAGKSGGTLGYGTNYSTTNGVPNAYTAVGFDVYGNCINEFGNAAGTGTNNGARTANNVCIGGSGNLLSGYRYLTGSVQTTIGSGTNWRKAEVIVTRGNGTGCALNAVCLSVRFSTDNGGTWTQVYTDQRIDNATGQAAIPDTFKIGFSGSTGGSNNKHYIDNVQIDLTGAQLDILKAGAGTGTVTSTSSPTQTTQFNCGATCAVAYPGATVITLTATPSAGSSFTGWSGGTGSASCTGTGTCAVTLNANSEVTANFAIYILPSCTYSLSTSALSFSASNGTDSFNVNQNETSCANSGWTAASNSSWITITSGSSGNWSIHPVTLTVSANTTNAQRTGAITITGQSNTATMTITQSALLTLSPNALNYGTLKTSESATKSLTVTNTSGSSLTISGVNITGADSSDFTLTNNCNTLSNNGTCTLDVKFAPTTEGSKTATLTITANSITFTVALTGTADNNANPLISVTPSVITGYVDIAFSSQQAITISNTGTGTLLIQDIRLYGKSMNEYTVAGSCSVVLPQKTCAITLASAYTSNEAKEASLVITSNASNASRLELPISMESHCSQGSINLTPVSATVSSGALTAGITVTAPDNCWWMTSSNAAWISAAANWAHGNGTANYTVSANTGSASRIGTLNIAGIPYKVIQNGAGTNIPNDISGDKWENNINALYSAGIATSASFYPYSIATKEDIAVYIIRAVYGETFTYTTAPYFSDVPVTHPSFKYVQKLKDDNITLATGVYGINSGLTRSWAAVFIIRAIYGEGFSYPAAPYFSDVPVAHVYFKYIQKMKERGFTHVSGVYYPDDLMPRDALAAFIAEAFLGMEHD